MYNEDKLEQLLAPKSVRNGSMCYEIYEIYKRNALEKKKKIMKDMEALWDSFNEIVGNSRTPVVKLYKSSHPNAEKLTRIVLELTSILRYIAWLDNVVDESIKYED